jgi:hypothetical protein
MSTSTTVGKATAARGSAEPVRWARVARAVVWLALAALLVRAIGAGVGGWAAGRLGLFTTLFLGAVLPAWVVVFLPTWLAWRVLRPLGLRRGVRACLWLSPITSLHDLPSIEAFSEVLAGRPLPRAEGRSADAWTALACALQAEQQGSRPRAERILDVLTHLPDGCRVPLLARVFAVEALAFTAFKHGDWPRVLRYVRLGEGRLVRLLSLLALAELGQPVRPCWLLASWALAPKRRATLAQVRAALARQSSRSRSIPPPAPLRTVPPETRAGVDPRLRHLLLLGRATRGEPIQMREVLALADAWQTQLDEQAMAQVQARALELDAREGAQQAGVIREAIVGELTLLGLAAEGDLPPRPVEALRPATELPGSPSLAEEVRRRLKEQLFKDVADALDGLEGGTAAGPVDALDAWERWLVLRSALDRLLARAGESASASVWHSDIRNRVWGFASALFDQHQQQAAWVAHIVFAWLAERAECLNDMQAALMNRENARLAQRAASW